MADLPDSASRSVATDEYYASEKPHHRRYLLEYHVQLCDCQDPTCLHAHSQTQLRRVPVLTDTARWSYFPHKCKQGLTCTRKSCPKSHNDDEVKFHPTVYKTKPCPHSQSPTEVCTAFGLHCPFAHSPTDQRSVLRPSPLPKTNSPPAELLQGQAELERLRRLVVCQQCGQAEKEWVLDCGHLLCAGCGPRQRECPSCAQPVRRLRAVRLA